MMTDKELKNEKRDKIIMGVLVVVFGFLILSGIVFWSEHIAKWFNY